MDVIALGHSVRDVGSRVPCSKRRATWSFIIRGRQHELVLVHSPSSPSKPTRKLLLSVDGHELVESRELRVNHALVSAEGDEVWRHTFDLSGQPLLVRVICVSTGRPGTVPMPGSGLGSCDQPEPVHAPSAGEVSPTAHFAYSLSIGGQPFESLAGAPGAHGAHAPASAPHLPVAPSTRTSAAAPSLATAPAGAVPERASQSCTGASSAGDTSGPAPAQGLASTVELLASTELERDKATLRRFHRSLLSLGVALPDLPGWVNSPATPSAGSASASAAHDAGCGPGDGGPSSCDDHHPWQLLHDEHGNQYFFNPETRESRWELPPRVTTVPAADNAEIFC